MFRQVSKQDFEVLKKYHKAEIRYYVDISGSKRASTAKKPKKGKIVINATGTGSNQPVILIKSAHEFKDGTVYGRMYTALKTVFKDNPTTPMGRVTLRDTMVGKGFGQNQVAPFISDCIHKYKILKLMT
jgi:hypothetical protein